MEGNKNTLNSQNSGDINILEIIGFLWSKRKFLVIFTGIVTLLGILYALLSTPMFESKLTLYPAEQEKDVNSGLKQVAAQFGFGGFSTSNNYNIPDVVKSRRIRKKIVAQKWKTLKSKNKKIELIEFWGINEKNKRLQRELAIKRLSDLLSVSTYDETGLITISILTEDPLLSAEIVNYVGDEVQNYIRNEQQSQSKKNRLFIEKRLLTAKKELSDAEEALKNFKEVNRVITESPEIHLQYNRLKRDIELKQEIYITLEKQKELALIEEQKNLPIINILDIGEVAIRKSKPKRVLIIFSSFFLGFLLSIISVFIIKAISPILSYYKKL